MLTNTTTAWALVAVVFSTGSSATGQKQQSYIVTQTLNLRRELNGVDGVLRLLIDARLNAHVREELWGKGGWSFVFSPESELFKEFSGAPPANSKLEARDNTGKLLAERTLEKPLAKIEEWRQTSTGVRYYLITEDYSTGFGSYNGLRTCLVQILNGAIKDVSAVNVVTHQEEPIRLMKALKSNWKVVTGGNSVAILYLSCLPTEDGQFRRKYARYSFDGTRWLEYERFDKGFWESDEPFPPRSAFP